MSEAISILDEVRRGGYDFCFVATYNAYLPFYEEVVLPRLASAGCRANVLMMDARQCAAALSEESTRPRRAGAAYTLMPVRAGGAFHPKVILLVGRRKGLLFVGSHNMTISGLSLNRELTNRFEFADDKDRDEVGAIKASWEFLRAWAAEQPTELQETFNSAERSIRWLREGNAEEGEPQIYGSLSEGASLWETVRTRVPPNVRRVTVVAPYFDHELAFLRKLNDELTPKEFVVGVDAATAEINSDARTIMPEARFVDASCLREGSSFLHAKALLFETANEELLITGSANASSPAWLAEASERNAEIVVLRFGSRRRSLAAELGLKELHSRPRLTEEEWGNIIRPKRKATTPASVHHVPLVAVETADGFKIDTRPLKSTLLPQVILLNDKGERIGDYEAVDDGTHLLNVAVTDAETRRQASVLSLQVSGGKRLLASVHHTFSVPTSAQTERQKQLDNAFHSLSGDAPLFDEMFRLIDRVVFDETEDTAPAPGGARKQKKAAQQEPSEEQTVFASSLRDARTARLRERFASTGDLGLLLDALNRRLGVGLEAEVTANTGVARSEEEGIGSDDEELASVSVSFGDADEAETALACQRKTARMMRRMTAQLERAAALKDAAFVTIAQLAAVLGVLLLLRELGLKRARSLKGETYIPYKDERKFFLDGTRLLYAQRSAVMEQALSAYGPDEMRAEVGTAVGLLFWMAYDIGIDLRYEFEQEDRKEREAEVREMARLLAMAPQFCDGDFNERKARDAVMRFGTYDEEQGATAQWYEEHSEWMKTFAELHREPQKFNTVRRMPNAGDLSYLTRAESHKPFVVLDSDGASVKVVDLDKESEKKNYSSYGIGYIAIVDIE